MQYRQQDFRRSVLPSTRRNSLDAPHPNCRVSTLDDLLSLSGCNQHDYKRAQVILNHLVGATSKESDMELVTDGTVELKVPEGSKAVLVKNLYLSCDPYMRNRMTEHSDEPSYIADYVPGETIIGYGVCNVVDSGLPDYKVGDYVRGMTGWEEYNFLTEYRETSAPKNEYPYLDPSFYHSQIPSESSESTIQIVINPPFSIMLISQYSLPM